MSAPSFDGLLVIDKPPGITSRAAVDRAQRWFPRGTRLGHTGTLDPLATGVLVLCAGVATRLTEYVQHMAKTYRTTIRLGARSDSDDADGVVTPVPNAVAPPLERIEECARGFFGDIEQVPPAFSAAKVAGRRAYDLARAGREVNLTPRRVRIDAIDILHFSYPRLELEIHCGKGTYIRSLARDLGERLGCGGYVEELRRTRVGPFRAEDALSLETEPLTARARLLKPELAVAELPRLTVRDEHLPLLRNGAALALDDCRGDVAPNSEEAALFTSTGTLLGVATLDWQSRRVRPSKVLK